MQLNEVVYFCQLGSLVKIGASADPADRLRKLKHEANKRHGLRVPYYAIPVIIATEPGGRERERQLHKQFAAARVEGTREWFHATPELEAYIGTLEKDFTFDRFSTKNYRRYRRIATLFR